jgi:hypothetical protein
MYRRSKLVGFFLIGTIGMFPSLALACAGPTMQSCHPCCAHKTDLQFSVATNDSAPLAPCCTVSSDNRAPATESQLKANTARADRPIATVTSITVRPSRAGLNTEPLQAVPLAPAQATLCTFLI